MKTGYYGGSFDPIHVAHLIIAQIVLDELCLDKIVFVPAALPPHKEVFASPSLRLAMVEAAIAGNPRFSCSTIEIDGQVMAYSIDTIVKLKQATEPDDEFYWILGADNFADFSQWKSPERIAELCHIVVFPRGTWRPNSPSEGADFRHIHLDQAPQLDISSTNIRAAVADGRSIQYLVPSAVGDIIAKKSLYTKSQ